MNYPTEPRWLIESLPQVDMEWRRVVVMVLHGGQRSHHHLARDRCRFARSSDLQRLCDRYPTVAEEVTAWVEQEGQA